jgi:hypothetical protein
VSIEPELHATSNTVLDTLDRLRALELEKRQLPVGSPRLVELAKEIERLATTVLGTSDTQVDLAKAAVEEARAGVIDPETTIDEMGDAPRDVHTILADWRDVERRLGETEAGSADAARLRAEIELLRSEYRRAHDAAARRTSGGE